MSVSETDRPPQPAVSEEGGEGATRKGMSTRAKAGIGLLAAAGVAAVLLVPAGRGKGTLYVGHYGYQFRLTPETTAGHSITSTFRDEARTAEVVFVHPKRIDAQAVFRMPESDYAGNGVLRLEVNPNSAYPPKVQDRFVEAFRYAARKTLEERGDKFRFAELEGAPLPGFAIEIQGAKPVTQVFMKGEEVHYLFTSAGDNAALHEILSSLEDTRPVAPPPAKPS